MKIADDAALDERKIEPQQPTHRQMSRRGKTTWIAGSVLAAGAMIALAVSSPANTPGSPNVNSLGSGGNYEPRTTVAPLAEADDIPISRAGHSAVEGKHVALPATRMPSASPADRELEMGDRHAVELNEMICRETGQNCEFARMARRHHEERYGEF